MQKCQHYKIQFIIELLNKYTTKYWKIYTQNPCTQGHTYSTKGKRKWNKENKYAQSYLLHAWKGF